MVSVVSQVCEAVPVCGITFHFVQSLFTLKHLSTTLQVFFIGFVVGTTAGCIGAHVVKSFLAPFVLVQMLFMLFCCAVLWFI